jgi:hypothetical protein
VHVGCATESVGVMMEGTFAFCNIWSCRLWEMKICIRTEIQNYVRQPEIKSIIVLCVMSVIWLHLEHKWKVRGLLWRHHIWEAENMFVKEISWSASFSLQWW